MNLSRNCRFFAATCAAALLAGAGCGAKLKPVKVEGVVTLDGKPLPGASVAFVPVKTDGSGRPAGGRTEEDGSFRLTTFNTDDGALPGEYRVTVSCKELTGITGVKNPMEELDKAKLSEIFSSKSPENRVKRARQKQPPSLVPAVYADVQTTPLRVTVPTEGKVDLELRSTAR